MLWANQELNNIYLFIFNYIQVLSFFDQDYLPTKCTCGLTMTFHVANALNVVEKSVGKDCVNGVTDKAIRSYIKSKKIGCVGGQVNFRNSAKQVHAVHVQRNFFKHEDVIALDESK